MALPAPTAAIVVVAVPLAVTVVVLPANVAVVTPPEAVTTVVVVAVVVAVTVVVLETVGGAVTELSVAEWVVVELEVSAEEADADVETAVDREGEELKVVDVVSAMLADSRVEELINPQPARMVVAATTTSRVLKATLDLFKRTTK